MIASWNKLFQYIKACKGTKKGLYYPGNNEVVDFLADVVILEVTKVDEEDPSLELEDAREVY